MINNSFNRTLSFLLSAAVISFLCLNCHTSKSHEAGNNDTVKKEQTEKKEPTNKEMDKPKKSDTEEPGLTTYNFDEPIPLSVGNTVMVGSKMLKLRLRKVGESRCPTGVNCIQAGKAKVELMLVRELDMVTNVELYAKGLCKKTDGSCGNSASSQGFNLSLITLTPYPGDNGKNSISQEEYVATVVVEKE